MSRSFTAAWLAAEPTARALLPFAAGDHAARVRAVERAAARAIDPAVLAALVTRYAADPEDSPRRRHLARLAAGNAACVVTGQQAGLFGGPLYSVHKAASAIRLAARLEAESGVPCAPIFWLQSEDHDFAEIATTWTLAGNGVEALTVADDAEHEGRAVADRPLGPSIEPALAALDAALEGLSDAAAVMDLWRRSYRPDRSPVLAFRHLMEQLFAEWGLLVLDPRDPKAPELAAAAAPLHARAVADAAAIAEALEERVAALHGADFSVQVHVRPGAPLSFWHETPSGPRVRLEPGDDGWRTCEATPRVVDRGEIRRALDDAPRRFSTSALLRPILQDLWLPTAAYVGGPGEIAYFAQLPPLYAHFGLPLPLVVHRCRFRIIDSTADRLLDQLGLDADRLGEPRHVLLAAVAGDGGAHPDPATLQSALTAPVEAALADFAPHAAAVDKGLAKMVDKTRDTVVDVVGRLVERYRRTLARNDEVTLQRLDRLLARLQPNGGPQERTLGLPWFAARYGIAPLMRAVVAAADPCDDSGARLRDLRP